MSKSTQAVEPTTGEINVEAVQAFLVPLFSKILTLDGLINDRNKCFRTVAEFRSPKTKLVVGDVLAKDEIGEVLNRIRDAKIALIAGSADCGF